MDRHPRHVDAKSLLIAGAVATLAYGGAIVGSTRAGASVDSTAVTRQFVASAAAEAHAAVTTQVKHTEALALAPLDQAEAAVRAQVREGAFPGAAVAIGREGEAVRETGIGRVGWTASAEAVDARSTLYDLASLTKVVATTPAVMLLVQDGKMDLDAPVVRYLPEFSGGGRDAITVRMLLTHSSGLPAGVVLTGATGDDNWHQLLHTPLAHAPGTVVEYSDVGMNVLFAAAQRAAGEPLPDLLRRRVWQPLGMTSTTYQPGDGCAACAPTFRDAADEPVRGVVHDPIARKLGGVAGNAGLFSTAHDVGRYAAMLANGGELDGVRIFTPETVKLFTTRQADTGTRALGWDTPGPNGSGGFGVRASKTAFGHTGFTGTSISIDPARHTWTVLLSNRVYQPHAPNQIMALRRKLNDRVAAAADDFDVVTSAQAD